MISRFRSLVGRGPDDAKGEAADQTRRKIAEKNRKINALRARLEEANRALELARSPVAAGEDLRAFFVVGRAKSGTSWLRSILDAHPEILCVNEGRFFGRDYRGTGRAMPRSLYGAVADSEYLTAWIRRSPWSRDGDPEEHLRGVARQVAGYFLADRLARTGKKIAGDKTPLISTEVVKEIAEMFPEAKVIHIIRDGRDVAVSSMHHIWNNALDRGGHHDLKPEILSKRDRYRADPAGFVARGESIFGEGQLAPTARNWSALVGRARQDGYALLGENYGEVRYEDLLEEPLAEAARLLEFLGAEAGEQTVLRCVEQTSFEAVSSRARGQEDSSSFFRKGIAGDWKNVFTEDDGRVFKETAGELLVKLGYEKDYRW